MRVVQIVPALQFGDAVGNDALAIKSIVAEAGLQTEIYAERIDDRLPDGAGKDLRQMPQLSGDDILLYHACTGSHINYDLPRYGGKRAVVYHNITPAHFFDRYNAEVARIQNEAYAGIRYLVQHVDYCVADSEYNKNDLVKMGYTGPIDVCPIIIPYDDYRKEPDGHVLNRYRADDLVNLLFVGRIAPNKAQEDVIKAFYCYQKYYNPRSRLFIVGSGGGFESYEDQLHAYARRLGLGSSVVFTGHVGFTEILAYYELSSVFVCMSEHEGFCVPLVEAMLFDLPILAYKSSAIPDTLGSGGLLLDDKDPYYAAALIDQLVNNDALRNHIKSGRQTTINRFSYDVVKGQFMQCLNRIINM